MSPSPRTLVALAKIPVGELKGVGPKKATGLKALGIETVFDLLHHYPRRHVDRTKELPIGDLLEGQSVAVTANVLRSTTKRFGRGRAMAEIVLDDGTGTLACSFFNQPRRAKQFSPGQRVTVFGKVTGYRGKLQMASPLIDNIGDLTGRFIPIYPQSAKAKVSSIELFRHVTEALERTGDLADPVEGAHLRALRLVGRTAAYRGVHVPEGPGEAAEAKARLAFDELLRLQLLLVARKRQVAASALGVAHDTSPGRLVGTFVAQLPFGLTQAQSRAIAEIAEDLAAPHPMNRLLQGDVGAGKTVVALVALLYGVQGGHQGAFMVPTEVLAEQHFYSVCNLLDGFSVPDAARLEGARPVRAELLTSRVTAGERSRLLAGLASGQIDVLVGTQALLSEDVGFSSLGVVVVDEQHRFGVEQRAALGAKGPGRTAPDLLVMTATPIPRTAAMTVYGDLDHTTLDEMPPGRTPITTRWLGWEREAVAWKRVRDEIAAGHQAFVVCPLVGGGLTEQDEVFDDGLYEGDEIDWDEDDEDGIGSARRLPGVVAGAGDVTPQPPRAAVEERDRLAAGELRALSVGLLHGQMTSKEKDEVMSAFRRGEIDVVVATTVVEVGVDVPNATVMVIEDADRFGIAQLHQLRGRVGRGKDKSWCFLLADPTTELAEGRLGAMVATENGFELAERDLDLRGGGTVLGSRQKGRTDLRIANLGQYRALVAKAREVASAILDADPELRGDDHRLLWDETALFWSEEEREFLFRS